MTLRPLNLVPGEGEGEGADGRGTVEESLRVRLPADLPEETLRAVEAAMSTVARAVMAGRVQVSEAPTGDNVTVTFEVELHRPEAGETRAALEALTRFAPPREEESAQPAAGRAERRAAMVGRIREANAETLRRLADL
ncbi:hypothetical protein ACWEQL_19880 [Kitasatospora sp. NPDC004240]